MTTLTTEKIPFEQSSVKVATADKPQKDRLSPYLKRVEEAMARSLSQMEPYEEDKYIQKITCYNEGKTVVKQTSKLPFYPHVELGTAPIEVESIEDLQKIRPFGRNTNKSIATRDDRTVNKAQKEHTIRSTTSKPDSELEIRPKSGGKMLAATAASAATTRKREACLIESTSNSVRISFLFKAQANAKTDPLEASILFQWMRSLMVTEHHPLLRKKPIDGYSVTFLVTNRHLAMYGRQRVEEAILSFCAKIDKECSDIKLQVNAQARYVTTALLKAFNNYTTTEPETEE